MTYQIKPLHLPITFLSFLVQNKWTYKFYRQATPNLSTYLKVSTGAPQGENCHVTYQIKPLYLIITFLSFLVEKTINLTGKAEWKDLIFNSPKIKFFAHGVENFNFAFLLYLKKGLSSQLDIF